MPHISELERMKEELRRAQDEASRAQRRLLAFTQAAQAVQRARTPAEVYRTVGEEVVRLGFNAVVFSLTPDRASLTVSHTTFDPTLLQAAVKLTGIALQDYRMPLVPGGFYQRIIAEGQTIFTDRNRTAEIVAEGLPGPLGPLASRLASLLRIGQGIAARLTVGGETHGVLLITGTGLTEAEVPAVTAFASQTAVRLENARVEEALRKSEEKYRTLYESSVDGIISTDMKGQILDANQAYLDMLGYSKDELRRLTHQQLTPLKWHECEADIVKNQILARGYSDEYEKEYIRKDGTAFPISIRVWLVKNEQGPPVEMWGIVRDITAHKRAEEELRRSEERYRAFTVATAQVVWITNAGGEVVVDLPSWRELTGQSEEAIKGWRWIEAIHPDDRERVAQVWAKAVEAKGPYESEFRVRKYDGSYRLFFARGIPVLEADGSIREWVGTCTDITERKRAEAELKKHREHLGELVEERTAKLKRTNEALEAEITERKQGAAALRESEAKYHALFQASADGILVADLETRMFSYANPAACRLLGYSEAELTTMGVADIHSKDDLPWVVAEFEAQARGDKTLAAGLPFLRKDGAIVYADVSAVGMSVDGRVCIAGFLRDITERKRAEQALREAEEQFRSLFVSTPLPTFLWDLETLQYLEVNDAAVCHSGYSRDELLRMRVTDLLPPEAAPSVLSQMQVLRTQSRDRGQGRHRLKDGRVVDVEVDAHALHFRGRRAVLGVIQDITERKRAQQALQESEERYRDLAENAAELIQSVSPQGQFLYVNHAWRQTLGYSEGEIARLSITDILSPQHLTRYQQVAATVMAGETVNDVETVFVAKNGTQITVEGSVNCKLVDGKAVATSGIFRNVTARREIEKMKDEFVSTVSHELRTPLTSIRGSLGLLAGGLLAADPGKARRMVDIAMVNTDRLVRLINDILDIERIESGRVKMEKRACEAASLMLQAVDSVRELADKAGVKLEVSPGPGRILADPDRVIQTMTNLLGNAIKFSPQGSTISLNLRRQNGDMLFEVKDRGRGIPADKLTVIFERFQQVDASDRREKGGTGLGLAICRSIVEQHGGRIWVESVLGQGSSFYFTLPVMEEEVVPVIPAEEEVVPVIPAEAPGARTVLVCDDDASILAVVQELLQQRGYRVVAVGSGPEAVKQAVAQLPGAILLDLLMPEMNGWETMTALRKRPETCEIPIIILSVLPPRDLRKTDVEVAGWIQKPVDETLLFQTLSIAISRPGKPARVLVVEDDVDLARVIREVFERHGHKVYVAQTGRQAVQLAEHVLPNLVVLDLVLPEGDGFEVVSALRQNKVLRCVPLVVHTAKDLDDAERARLRLGKTVFLTKGRGSHEEFEKQVLGLLKGIMSATVERGSP